MTTLLFTLGIFLLVMGGMAIGVAAGRKPIQGSCGGISAFTKEDCPVCGGNPAKCEVTQDRDELAVDAMKGRGRDRRAPGP